MGPEAVPRCMQVCCLHVLHGHSETRGYLPSGKECGRNWMPVPSASSQARYAMLQYSWQLAPRLLCTLYLYSA